MDASTLAAKMLQWEETQRQADALRREIEAAVLAIDKTQTVGNVRASYTAGRRTFDYQAAIVAAEAAGQLNPGSLAPWESNKIDYFEAVQAAIEGSILDSSYLTPYTETVIDYAAAVKALGLEAPVIDQKPASVTVKLLA